MNFCHNKSEYKLQRPFIAAAIRENFNLQNALQYGLLPIRFNQKNPDEALLNYFLQYVEREVKAKRLVRLYSSFTRFLQTMSFSHGSLLNVTNVAQECHASRTTVNDWLAILEDLLICFQLPLFSKRAKRELTAHPKFYFFDTGVYRALRRLSIQDTQTEVDGPALEGLVAQHLMAWKDYTKELHEIAFWRTRSGSEVDFVVYGALGFWAIEVKNSTKIRPEDLRGLISFKEDYPKAQPILLYRGAERLMKQGVLCLPCEDFLKNIKPDTPLYV